MFLTYLVVQEEFCSRGVKSLIAVESNNINANYISKQFESFGFTQAKAIKSDTFRYLKSCKQKFDVIFADPPYELENIEDIHRLVFENNLLSDTSYLIIEHGAKTSFCSYPYFIGCRKYGSVHFSFFDPTA